MKKYYGLLGLLFAQLSALEPLESESLINKEYIVSNLMNEAAWSSSHGASHDDLGTGMFYYGLTYSAKAKVCVCLGSGGGFVPRLMRQAQRDLKLSGSKTILVDGNVGKSRPEWFSKRSFFRRKFSDVEIIIGMTHDVALNQGKSWQIDYLHIDADRTFHGAYQDFVDYLPLMSPGGIITLHDTGGNGPCARVADKIRELGYQVINFEHLGAGVALIYIR